jgi:hypothetical protein
MQSDFSDTINISSEGMVTIDELIGIVSAISGKLVS